jgi:hypothetical protein
LLLQTVVRDFPFSDNEGGNSMVCPENREGYGLLTLYSNVNLSGSTFSHGLPAEVLQAELPMPAEIGGPFSYFRANDDTQPRCTLQLLGGKEWFNMPSEHYLGRLPDALTHSSNSYLPGDGRLGLLFDM